MKSIKIMLSFKMMNLCFFLISDSCHINKSECVRISVCPIINRKHAREVQVNSCYGAALSNELMLYYKMNHSIKYLCNYEMIIMHKYLH